MEYGVDGVAGAEFQTVVAIENLSLNALPVHERAMFAALVHNKKLAVLGDDDGVVARDPGIGNDQVLLHLAANTEGAVVEIERSLFGSLNEDQAGKDAGTQAGNRTDNGLSRHGATGRLVYQDNASKIGLREVVEQFRSRFQRRSLIPPRGN